MKTDKIRILMIFGGKSSEHEVSRMSISSILRNINAEKYEIICMGITKGGEWKLTNAGVDEIEDGSWEMRKDNVRAILSPDAMTGGIITENNDVIKIDCVWPVLHGKYGEDGTIQGLCELAGLKYVGPDVCSSAICMDKAITKVLIEKTGIRQAEYYIAHETDFSKDEDRLIAVTEEKFNGEYPLFVKPTASGSSVGISKAHNRNELKEAYHIAFKEDDKVIVEEAITGQEVEVAVLGNGEPAASRVGEILSAGEWYDYQSKYADKNSRTVIPANITADVESEIRESALKIYKTLGCRVLSRVDFFVQNNSEVIFNEINTLPGFTEISMYPMLWKATGIEYSELLDRIIEYSTQS